MSEPLLWWFRWYGQRFVARHFHAVRLSRSGTDATAIDQSLVIYLNHASWWDPMVCLLAARRLFGQRRSYAPIDSKALDKYNFFRLLGFFPVEQGTGRGASSFIRTASQILSRRDAMLWLTPQGRFADVRERPLAFRGGLAALARRVPHAVFVPLAIEYVFWEERLPEILLRFGRSVSFHCEVNETGELERALDENMARLSEEAIARRASDFTCLLRNRSGVSACFDLWRNLRAWGRGGKFNPQHGTL